MPTIEDEHWMRRAIALAQTKGREPGCTPIAALIVHQGRLIAHGVNRTQEECDATAHAEILAIRAAGRALGDMDLGGATLYTTLQPCGMCTMAALRASIGRIVYGAGRDDVHAMYFEDRHLQMLDFIRDAYSERLHILAGCLAPECAGLYYRPNDPVPREEQANL